MNAFEVLGLAANANEAQVRAAYRNRVKRCHPDQFQEKEEQERAQEELIQLNLAYEEALRITAQRQVGYQSIPLSEAKTLALRMLEQKRPDNALRQLMRAEQRDAEWYFMQGEVLMQLRQYASAHQSYREATRQEPDNLQFRRGAFEAAKAIKRHAQPLQRAADALSELFRSKRIGK